MNEEERQGMMDFILQRQANLDALLAELAENDKRADARLSRLERVLKLAVRAGLRERREWRERYEALVDAQVRAEDTVRGLTAATERNSEDINRLIMIVERNIVGRNGGETEPESGRGE